MARKVQLRNRSGQKIYPLTSSANVMMSDKSGSLDGKLSEFDDKTKNMYSEGVTDDEELFQLLDDEDEELLSVNWTMKTKNYSV